MLDVPIPHPSGLPRLDSIKPHNVDAVVEDAFQLKEPERALISDLLEFGYREGASKSAEKPSRQPTVRSQEDDRDDVFRYADFFIKALRATFGKERAVRATIFEEAAGEVRLPVRMVAIHLDWPERRRLLKKETMQTARLRMELVRSYKEQLAVHTRDGQPIASGLGFRRVARVFITHKSEEGRNVPTVLYLKPDQRRYWTRSQGLRDADELAAAIVTQHRQRMTPK
jgi:hypothetical protein